jgi:hypothetical protein
MYCYGRFPISLPAKTEEMAEGDPFSGSTSIFHTAIGDRHLKNQSRSYASPKSDKTEAFDTKDSEGHRLDDILLMNLNLEDWQLGCTNP